MVPATYQDDLAFLSAHTRLVTLSAGDAGEVAVAPQWQGRVMTSSAAPADGAGLGWINRPFIESGRTGTAFDNYGGEDRFWLGPEGGQFALWFRSPQPFDLGHWSTPAGFNTGRFGVTSQGPASVAMAARFAVTNYSGTTFEVAVKRVIDALPRRRVAECVGAALPESVACVAFESTNTAANVGGEPWTRQGGLVSIWALGQFNPLPRGMVIAPFTPGPVEQLGPMPNGEYFGPIGADRFRLMDDYLLFRCDGRCRSKLGISPRRAREAIGSYDGDAGLLTIVQFNLPDNAADLPYVNSLWEVQDRPFAGDVINSYNDGEEFPGAGQLGPFYEIETSSPAAELAPDQGLTHVHRTMHFTGGHEDLNAIAKRALGIDLGKVPFPRG
ncbi:MAG TPA: DUF6786 family protein [Phycisphaerae bacterium]|nr:DUF6786 family protein [Phycisphaerae bacterium]